MSISDPTTIVQGILPIKLLPTGAITDKWARLRKYFFGMVRENQTNQPPGELPNVETHGKSFNPKLIFSRLRFSACPGRALQEPPELRAGGSRSGPGESTSEGALKGRNTPRQNAQGPRKYEKLRDTRRPRKSVGGEEMPQAVCVFVFV